MRQRSLSELNRLSVEEFKQRDKLPVVLLLDNIRSALNVGSIFRSADAFAAEELALCGITAQPPHRDILKTAIGASQAVQWQYFEKSSAAAEYYRSQGYAIVAIEQTTEGQELQDFRFSQPLCIVLGNEVKGVSPELLTLADTSIEVPQWGTKHSLNVSVCAGVLLWELARQWRF